MSTDATFVGSAASPRPQPTAHSRSLHVAIVAQTGVATAVLLLLLLVVVVVALLMIAAAS